MSKTKLSPLILYKGPSGDLLLLLWRIQCDPTNRRSEWQSHSHQHYLTVYFAGNVYASCIKLNSTIFLNYGNKSSKTDAKQYE